MKEAYNAAWYAAQEITPWPFMHSPISDTGKLLPDSIISDIKLLMRGTEEIHITGVQVTDAFVSVVISSENGIIAACTVQQPIKPYRHYKLETFADNVVGVIVFGHGARTEIGSWQFSEHNALNPAAVVSMPGFPVLSIGKGTKLIGDITLNAGSDLILEKVDVSLGDTISDGDASKEDTLVGSGYKLSLSTNAALRSTTASTQGELLKEYAGPCTMRLTNKDCPYIVSINGVFPDADGNIDIKTSLSNPELKSITVTETGSYLYDEENSCKEEAKESVFVLIGDREEMDNQYKEGTFWRCGLDYCELTGDENNQEDFNTAVIVNDGKTEGVRVNQITGLLEPISGIRGKAAVKLSSGPKYKINAVFKYYYYVTGGSPLCAIIYNIEDENGFETYKELRFDGTYLYLGENKVYFPVQYGTDVTLSLSYSNKVFTGYAAYEDATSEKSKSKDSGEATKVLVRSDLIQCAGENKGGTGIYIEHCRCQSWSAI